MDRQIRYAKIFEYTHKMVWRPQGGFTRDKRFALMLPGGYDPMEDSISKGRSST